MQGETIPRLHFRLELVQDTNADCLDLQHIHTQTYSEKGKYWSLAAVRTSTYGEVLISAHTKLAAGRR